MSPLSSARKQNANTLIYRLHSDLLALVALHLADDERDPDFPPMCPPHWITITQVCHYLRTAIHETAPILWSFINMSAKEEWIQECSHRARGVPLTLYVSQEVDDQSFFELFARAREATFHGIGNRHILSRIDSFLEDVHRLATLRVHWPEVAFPLDARFGGGRPVMLSTLILQNISLSGGVPSLVHLVLVDLYVVEMNTTLILWSPCLSIPSHSSSFTFTSVLI
jgi:hypothetical protein